MLTYEKAAIGAAGVAAGGAYLGLRHLDPDESAGDRMKTGVLGAGVAAAVGFGGYGAYRSGLLKPLASSKLWSGAGKMAWSAAKLPVQTAKGIYHASTPVQAGLAVLASAGLYALGSHLSRHGLSEAAAVENANGDIEYVDPATVPQNPRKRGVSQRMRQINASGDMVLGAHRGRH